MNGHLLAISGSLRRDSLNSAALRAAAGAAPELVIDTSPAILPPFSPDLEADPPEVVVAFRRSCEEARGFLFAVPEYAFGIPGSFKNALDWTVGSGSIYRKPVALLKVSPPGRGAHVLDALGAVFTALGVDVTRHDVSVTSASVGADGQIEDAAVVTALRAVVSELAKRAG